MREIIVCEHDILLEKIVVFFRYYVGECNRMILNARESKIKCDRVFDLK